MAPELDVLTSLARGYLDREWWFHDAVSGQGEAPVELIAADLLRERDPGMMRLILGRGSRRFQLIVGWRKPTEVADVLRGQEGALLGSAEDGDAHLLVYDALADDACALQLLALATAERRHAERVRHVSTLVSHASLVFDEQLFMKCYRVLEEGPRPEVEAMTRLDEVGFAALVAPVGVWRAHGYDLALVREFLPSALEGRLLALTSLRDLLARVSEGDEEGQSRAILDPASATAEAGGDFASEMARLGAMTATLHLALSAAFGDRPADPEALALRIAPDESDPNPTAQREALAAAVAAIGKGEAGRVIRIHGDYHLRRVMRSESGWLVAGFADDPLYAFRRQHSSLPARNGSPIEDLADMYFSLRRVAREAVAQRPSDEESLADTFALAWEQRNQAAFLEGYVSTPGARRLLPKDPATTDLLIEAFELVRDERYEATSSEG